MMTLKIDMEVLAFRVGEDCVKTWPVAYYDTRPAGGLSKY